MMRPNRLPVARLLWIAPLAVALLSGCGVKMPPEQVEAINKVQSLGGKVSFRDGGYMIDLRQSPIEDEHLAVLKDIKNLKSLDLQDTRITDAGLKYLQELTTLDYVRVQGTQVTDEGADSLKKALPNTEVRH